MIAVMLQTFTVEVEITELAVEVPKVIRVQTIALVEQVMMVQDITGHKH